MLLATGSEALLDGDPSILASADAMMGYEAEQATSFAVPAQNH